MTLDSYSSLTPENSLLIDFNYLPKIQFIRNVFIRFRTNLYLFIKIYKKLTNNEKKKNEFQTINIC